MRVSSSHSRRHKESLSLLTLSIGEHQYVSNPNKGDQGQALFCEQSWVEVNTKYTKKCSHVFIMSLRFCPRSGFCLYFLKTCGLGVWKHGGDVINDTPHRRQKIRPVLQSNRVVRAEINRKSAQITTKILRGYTAYFYIPQVEFLDTGIREVFDKVTKPNAHIFQNEDSVDSKNPRQDKPERRTDFFLVLRSFDCNWIVVRQRDDSSHSRVGHSHNFSWFKNTFDQR